jgi:hypothetical protein
LSSRAFLRCRIALFRARSHRLLSSARRLDVRTTSTSPSVLARSGWRCLMVSWIRSTSRPTGALARHAALASLDRSFLDESSSDPRARAGACGAAGSLPLPRAKDAPTAPTAQALRFRFAGFQVAFPVHPALARAS